MSSLVSARLTSFEDEAKLAQFVHDAAASFAENPNNASFGEIGDGNFLALRWGLGNDCVLVLKQDKYWQPVNFQQAIPREAT